MKILKAFDELADIAGPIHWAMGVFDGIHMGHQFIISSARQAKTDQGGLLGVFTFDSHPMLLTRPDMAPPRIFIDEEEKRNLLEALDVDVLLSIPFNDKVSSLSPGEFLDRLATGLPVASISVGCDWKFGKNRQGDVHFLDGEGKRRGFSAYVHPHVIWNGERISSTRIRRHIREGDMEGARAMLGRPYSLSGEVVKGRQLGRQLGFPTANIRPVNELMPPFGVYAVRIGLDGKEIPGIANFGLRPTVDGDAHEPLLEVHLFDWDGDLYGSFLRIALVTFLRPERKFDSLDDLQTQIRSDCSAARDALDAGK